MIAPRLVSAMITAYLRRNVVVSAVSLVPLKLLSFFARWQKLVATQDGLLIASSKKHASLSWEQVDVPPKLVGLMPWNTVKVVSQKHNRFFNLLGRSARPFVTQCQLLWAEHHGARVCLFAAKVEKALSERYLSLSLLADIQSRSKLLLEPWQGWWSQAPLHDNVKNALQTLQEIQNWSQSDIQQFRAAFEQHQLERFKTYFDTIEKQPLTLSQRLACIKQEQNQLLLAAAGSGKTSVMVARAGYLIKTGYAKANQILLLAYGNDAAVELQQRLNKSELTAGVRAQTFHSLGLQIINKVEGKSPAISPLATQFSQLQVFIRQTLITLSEDKQYELALLKFVSRNASYLGEHRFSMVQTVQELFTLPVAKRVVKLLCELLSAFKEFGLTESLDKLKLTHHLDLEVLMPVFAEYQMELKQQGNIDFTDMIALAIQYVDKGKFVPSWTNILVDEFQDISRARVKLLKLLQARGKQSSIFAVGDDWQSIYRFSGSDVSLTTHFSEHFNPSDISVLDTTFRFHKNLLNVSSRFITQNPLQCIKSVTANAQDDLPAYSKIGYEGECVDGYASILQILQMLNSSSHDSKISVLISARFSRDLPPIDMLKQWQGRFRGLDIQAMTVHASKGKEADYAIVVGLRSGRSGFPCNRTTLPLLDALLPIVESYDYAEERRLFYVALTRAKRHVYLLFSKSSPSEFVEELS